MAEQVDTVPARIAGIHACHADAVTKLLMEKGIIMSVEFKQKLLEGRATYQRSDLLPV
jgi:hypothetical protein